MRRSDPQAGLYSCFFKGPRLSEDAARMEEEGELLRPDNATVAQRLLERKGANWWEEAVPANVPKRVENRKAVIEINKWLQAPIGADISHT